MKKIAILGIAALIVIGCIFAAGCTAQDVSPVTSSVDTPVEEYSTIAISCNVDGALVQLFDGKVLVAKETVTDGVALIDIPVGTTVRTATVTADGYELIDPVPVSPADAGKVSVYMVELTKKSQ